MRIGSAKLIGPVSVAYTEGNSDMRPYLPEFVSSVALSFKLSAKSTDR